MPKPYCGFQRPPRGRRYGGPGQCFKIGLRSGYAAGISKGQDQGKIIGKNLQAIVESGRTRITRSDLPNLSLRTLGVIARSKKIPRYGLMNKATILDALNNANFNFINYQDLRRYM